MEPTSKIVMNSADIEIQAATVKVGDEGNDSLLYP